MSLDKLILIWKFLKKNCTLPLAVILIILPVIIFVWAWLDYPGKTTIIANLLAWLSLNVHTKIWVCIVVVICTILTQAGVYYFWKKYTKPPSASNDERLVMIAFAADDNNQLTFDKIKNFYAFRVEFRTDIEIKHAINMLIMRRYLEEQSGSYKLTSSGLKHVAEYVKEQRLRTTN